MQTEMLDRITPPAFKIPESVEINEPNRSELSNGIPVYCFHSEKQDLVKIDFIFDLNHNSEKLALVSSIGSSMLNEGTSEKNSEEIANEIDHYGAFLRTQSSKDTAVVTLYCLNKHLESVLPVIEQVVKDSVFPEKELEITLKNAKQKFLVRLDEVDFLAHLEFNRDVFGSSHAYGFKVEQKDYDELTRQNLLDFYKRTYGSNNCKIMLTGNIRSNSVELIGRHFGGVDWGVELDEQSEIEIPLLSKLEPKHIKKRGAVQCAIRIGKRMINKTHEDYTKLQVLNTVFGGYFGSRLMSNLREDKGLTYGIYSALQSYKNGGCFVVAMETGVENNQIALDEIYSEFKRLREQTIDAKELELVKNYLFGEILRSTDGIFATSDYYKGLLLYDLNSNYLSGVMKTINETNPLELQELAQKYFSEDTLQELVVG